MLHTSYQYGLRRSMVATIVLLIIAGLPMAPGLLRAQPILDKAPELQGVGIDEHLGVRLPLDGVFTDQTGTAVTLADYFHDGSPVILNMVYYSCPMLCNLTLNGLTAAVKKMDWVPGKQFRMVTVSINPREAYALAAAKRSSYLRDLGKAGAESGWSFLVGEETESKRLAEALGYHYYWDEKQKEYAHAAATFILTPDGRVSRYLYGIDYDPKDVRLALLEASQGKLGSTLDRLILYCYHYDPSVKGYVVMATSVMKLGGGATVLVLGLFLGTMWWREQRQRRQARPGVGVGNL